MNTFEKNHELIWKQKTEMHMLNKTFISTYSYDLVLPYRSVRHANTGYQV